MGSAVNRMHCLPQLDRTSWVAQNWAGRVEAHPASRHPIEVGRSAGVNRLASFKPVLTIQVRGSGPAFGGLSRMPCAVRHCSRRDKAAGEPCGPTSDRLYSRNGCCSCPWYSTSCASLKHSLQILLQPSASSAKRNVGAPAGDFKGSEAVPKELFSPGVVTETPFRTRWY